MEGLLRELSDDEYVVGGFEAGDSFRTGHLRRAPTSASHRRNFVYPVQRNRTRRIIGWFPSFIAGCTQPYHSQLELDWFRLADVTPGIASIQAQPTTISYWLDGIRQKYTPDAEVILNNGRRIMVEVKPYKEAVDPEKVPVWQAVRTRLADDGIKFKIITDIYLKAQPRHQTVLQLQMFNTFQPDPGICFRLSEMLADGTFEPLGRLISEFEDPHQARLTIMSLARRRRLRLDLTQPITNDMEISLLVPGWL